MVTKLDTAERMPVSGKVNKVIIFLHGYGADGADLISLSEPISKHLDDCFFSAPNAPRKCGAASFGFEWFPIPEIDGSTMPSMMKALAESEKAVNNLIEEYLKRFKLSFKDVMLVGFSQGTMISLNIGLRNTSILAGIVGFSGKILMPDSLKAEKKTDYPPVLLVHGDNDQVVPIAFLKEASEILQFLRVDHKTHVSKNVAHGISPDGLEQALVFMKDIFK